MTKTIPCKCGSQYQDSKYGKGQRIHNSCQKPASPNKILAWRCTVCGREVPADA